jgi:hypothetical protein
VPRHPGTRAAVGALHPVADRLHALVRGEAVVQAVGAKPPDLAARHALGEDAIRRPEVVQADGIPWAEGDLGVWNRLNITGTRNESRSGRSREPGEWRMRPVLGSSEVRAQWVAWRRQIPSLARADRFGV